MAESFPERFDNPNVVARDTGFGNLFVFSWDWTSWTTFWFKLALSLFLAQTGQSQLISNVLDTMPGLLPLKEYRHGLGSSRKEANPLKKFVACLLRRSTGVEMNAREIRLKRQGLSVEDGVPLLIRLICSTMADMCSGSLGSFADYNLMDRPGEIMSPFS